MWGSKYLRIHDDRRHSCQPRMSPLSVIWQWLDWSVNTHTYNIQGVRDRLRHNFPFDLANHQILYSPNIYPRHFTKFNGCQNFPVYSSFDLSTLLSLVGHRWAESEFLCFLFFFSSKWRSYRNAWEFWPAVWCSWEISIGFISFFMDIGFDLFT